MDKKRTIIAKARQLGVQEYRDALLRRRTEDRCPLCDKPMESLRHTKEPHKKGFHYWCEGCKHGWYVSDMKNIAAQNLEFTASGGKFGKSPEEIRQIIRKADIKKEEDNSGTNNNNNDKVHNGG